MDERFRFRGVKRIAGPPWLWANGYDKREGSYPRETLNLLRELEGQFDAALAEQCGFKSTSKHGMFGFDMELSDEDKIYRMNLGYASMGYVANAADSLIAAARGRAKRTLFVEMKMTASKGVLEFDVRDNGTGIDPDVKAAIFREDIDSEKSGKEGFIGKCGEHLLYTRQYIEHLGGEVGFTDYGRNKGATFFYKVPIASIIDNITKGMERVRQMPLQRRKG